MRHALFLNGGSFEITFVVPFLPQKCLQSLKLDHQVLSHHSHSFPSALTPKIYTIR